MTTDTVKKEIAVEVEIDGKNVTVGGMCKGSGMIHPNMCTMLGFVTTDAAISKEMLQKALSANIKDTFNMVSVDGDTSTNDTVLLLANGMAGNPEITEEGADFDKFMEALELRTTAWMSPAPPRGMSTSMWPRASIMAVAPSRPYWVYGGDHVVVVSVFGESSAMTASVAALVCSAACPPRSRRRCRI